MDATKKRDLSIDIIKALGILCVVWGHCEVPFRSFIYLFHMAIFFIASGYCYKSSASDSISSVGRFIWRKIKTLWFPYVLWTAIFVLLHNVLIKVNIYTNDPTIFQYVTKDYASVKDFMSVKEMAVSIIKACLFHTSTELGGAFWFIAALFELSIGYCIVDFIIRKIFKTDKAVIIGQGIVSVLFLGIGYFCSLKGISLFQLDRVFSSYILFYLGCIMKKTGICAKERKPVVNVIILVASFAILVICDQLGKISLGNNSYVNPLFLLVASLAGWEFLYMLAWLIKMCKPVTNVAVYIGQRTMPILIFHFLGFKLVNFIGTLVYSLPTCVTAAFPIAFSGILWWILYTIFGMGIPLGLNALYELVKGKLIRPRSQS